MRVELAVRDVQEIPGANGYIIQAVGHVPATNRRPEPPDDETSLAIPAWAPPGVKSRAFFPDAALSLTLTVEWRSFAVAPPGLIEHGSTILLDLEPGTVPSSPVHRGPVAPASRRS